LLEQPEGDFRIDHDQKVNATTNVQYVFEKRMGASAALPGGTIPASSPGAVGSLEDALALTADQRAAIGFFCGNQFATRDQALRVPAAGSRDVLIAPTTQPDRRYVIAEDEKV
jgi:hypothetical protein